MIINKENVKISKIKDKKSSKTEKSITSLKNKEVVLDIQPIGKGGNNVINLKICSDNNLFKLQEKEEDFKLEKQFKSNFDKNAHESTTSASEDSFVIFN